MDGAGVVTHMNVVSLEKGIASMAVFVTNDNIEIQGMTENTNRPITLAFENGNVYKGTVMEVAGLPQNYEGGVIQTDNPLALSLEGTSAAMELGGKCLTEHHGN